MSAAESVFARGPYVFMRVLKIIFAFNDQFIRVHRDIALF